MVQPTYRDFLGTLNVNLKVASALLDEALEDKRIESRIILTVSRLECIENEVMALTKAIKEAGSFTRIAR